MLCEGVCVCVVGVGVGVVGVGCIWCVVGVRSFIEQIQTVLWILYFVCIGSRLKLLYGQP